MGWSLFFAFTPFMTIKQKTFPDPLLTVPLATAKQHLRVEHDDDDALITAMIGAAHNMVESYTGAFLQTTEVAFSFDHVHEFTNIHAGPNATILKAAQGQPSKGVSYINDASVRTYLSDSQWEFDGTSYPSRLRIKDMPTDIKDTVNTWRVDVKTGFVDADRPDALVAALLLIVGSLYETRQDVSTMRTFQSPMAARHLMDRHRLQSFA